jgi:hypothetical protein
VVQLVGDDRVLGAEQRLEQAAVRVEARAVEDRVLRAEELAELAFEFLVRLLGAADEPHGGHAEAPLVEGALGGLDQARMISEPEVVVGAEVEHLVAITDPHGGVLRGADHALGLVEPGGPDLVDALAEIVLQLAVHQAPVQSRMTLPHLPSRAVANASACFV